MVGGPSSKENWYSSINKLSAGVVEYGILLLGSRFWGVENVRKNTWTVRLPSSKCTNLLKLGRQVLGFSLLAPVVYHPTCMHVGAQNCYIQIQRKPHHGHLLSLHVQGLIQAVLLPSSCPKFKAAQRSTLELQFP